MQPQELISCIEICIPKTPKSSIIQGCDHEHIFKVLYNQGIVAMRGSVVGASL